MTSLFRDVCRWCLALPERTSSRKAENKVLSVTQENAVYLHATWVISLNNCDDSRGKIQIVSKTLLHDLLSAGRLF